MGVQTELLPKLLAEGLGTFLLIFTIGENVLSLSGSWAGVSIGGALMVAIYAFGGISGGNFNPAVSIALGLVQTLGGPGMPWLDVLLYVLVQLAAGLGAGYLYKFVLGKSIGLKPSGSFASWQAGVAELVYTFFLVLVVLNVAKASKNKDNQYYGLAIGFVVVAGATGAGAISMGCFNPAVAVALDLTSMRDGFGWSLVYIGYELVGTVLAVGVFAVVRAEDFKRSAEELVASVVSEFIGTFLLVLTVGLNVLAGSPAAAFSISASLVSAIYALGSVSGGHFNPAVSLAVLLYGRGQDFTVTKFLAYVPAQLSGGICAGLLYNSLYADQPVKRFPSLGPGGHYGLGQALFSESVYTFLLSLVVLTVAVAAKTKSADFFALAIGFCVVIGGTAEGKISGGALNPAVSLGISSADALHGGGFINALWYSLAQLAAGAVAAGVVTLTHSQTSPPPASPYAVLPP